MTGMDSSGRELSKAFRQKRREMSITQAELADRAGCQQSAISMFEAGRTSAVAQKTVQRVAEILEVDLVGFDFGTGDGAVSSFVAKYCPIDGCPSNIPFAVSGELHFAPTMVRAAREAKTKCTSCGELLQAECPNRECRAASVPGGCCPQCGTAYVTPTREMSGWQVEQWADEQRAKIREVREMSGNPDVGSRRAAG